MGAPIFIFEGPDCVGKTTLAKTVARKCNGVYIHSTYKFRGKMWLYHLAQLRKSLRIAEKRPVILDRWWPSEVVYGNVYRDGPEYGRGYLDLHAIAEAYGAVYTFCMPMQWEQYWAFVQKNFHNEKQMFALDEARINRLWRVYRDIALDNYHLFPDRNHRLHYYNVVQDQYRCEWFADHIISRYVNWLKYSRTPEQKASHAAVDWRNLKTKLCTTTQPEVVVDGFQRDLFA